MTIKIIFASFMLVFLQLTGNSQVADTTISFKVSGTCGQCKMRIEKALQEEGVIAAKWNIETTIVTINYRPGTITVDALHNAVAATGHDTEERKAQDLVYNELPECCRYRELQDESISIADSSQGNLVTGVVVEDRKGQVTPLAGASLFWAGAGTGTITNIHGEFAIPSSSDRRKLVVSYAGFRTDTVDIGLFKDVQITLSRQEALTGILVTARQRPTYIDNYNPFRVVVITKKELLKAACCNLSESFETNPSVDVSYNDAITGSKQIQLLGLSGMYTQLTVENLPGPRGIATPLGLNSIAGPWMESIQLIKGTGSVVNGYESIAGQINVELKKPQTSEKLYLNGYINQMGKSDLNLALAQRINSKWSAGLLLHDNFFYGRQDFNKDGYRDLPTGNQFNLVHRWQYLGERGLVAHFGFKFLTDSRTGGEVDFNPEADRFTKKRYGLNISTRRYEVFGKTGYVFPEKMHRSIGWQVAAFDQRQDSYFGLTRYDAWQRNLYSNLIFQSRIVSDVHRFKTGVSFLYDEYRESISNRFYNRLEIVPGIFSEYTFAPNTNLDLVLGLRSDHHNLYGWFATPRLNLRYAPFKNTTLRLSVGRGLRTANIFAENIGLMASARVWEVEELNARNPYGLDAEIAWNKGISMDRKFKFFHREAVLSLDYFRNDFLNQVIVDIEKTGLVKIYNLKGRSFSNSLQAELNFTPVRRFDVRLAYRFNDVKTDYESGRLQKPFASRHRGFANLAYELAGWKTDFTINFIGTKRIPRISYDGGSQTLSLSPSYITMNAQVSKAIGKKKCFEYYIGAENLGNYFQKQLIISGDQPFEKGFDASMIWGPVSGRLAYTGFRYTIK